MRADGSSFDRSRDSSAAQTLQEGRGMDTDVSPAGSALSPGIRHVTAGEGMRPATTTVESRAHLAAAAYLMKRSGDSALVVTTDDENMRPRAVLTEADITKAVADGLDLEETRI